MTRCFKGHECDEQALHKSTKPISECKSYFTEENGRKVKNTEVPVLTCECIWRSYQKEAEDIIAPGGRLIADPKARNRAINAAYAKLWLHDHRFQWAGLAAFASKQVGCGLLHAADSIKKIQAEHDAQQRMVNSSKPGWGIPGVFSIGKVDEKALRDYEQARRNNPVPTADMRREGESLSLVQQQYQYVYEKLAMGNTTLFLDVFPLHAFYKKRGLKELKTCLASRQKIYGNNKYPVLWPVGQDKLRFGVDYSQILQAFEAIEAGNIPKSVEYLAQHEQVNILQPAMYNDPQLVALLRSNHASYVTGFPSGVAEAIELTLASQCRRVEDGRTIGFGSNPVADLSDINQRMPFVLKAAARFNEMLHNLNRPLLEQSIKEIAVGSGVQ
ncbi:hypothetical protein HNQ59_000345 [Chitinivorax tropicus]|uniref:Uncharacterized protein n=1 Tax=Chitinivorax tropicus TaxID=714531 RepID=A0A840MLL5_9PROT|nr:hypothetical protein [Chitinivorax tropicus]MBB5017083.1 hypothetical protein [Chitinivorax tropicus]